MKTAKTAKANLRKQASHYVKIVEWSDEDQCFIGRCPELFHGGTHGESEAAVYSALCDLVGETLSDMAAKKQKKPAGALAQNFSGKFVFRPGPALHKALALRAHREGKSLNQVILEAVTAGGQTAKVA